jgi:hypothetical protein
LKASRRKKKIFILVTRIVKVHAGYNILRYIVMGHVDHNMVWYKIMVYVDHKVLLCIYIYGVCTP